MSGMSIQELDAEASKYPDQVFTVHWLAWLKHPTLKIDEAVALSVGLEPLFGDLAWAMSVVDRIDSTDAVISDDTRLIRRLLYEFISRRTEAIGNVSPLGDLPVIEHDGARRVRLAEFAKWAVNRGWSLPAEFPREQAEARKAPASRSADIARRHAELKKTGVSDFTARTAKEFDVSPRYVTECAREEKGKPRSGMGAMVDQLKKPTRK